MIEWWSDQSPWVRYGTAVVVLLLAVGELVFAQTFVRGHGRSAWRC
jgi:hypothetical protein